MQQIKLDMQQIKLGTLTTKPKSKPQAPRLVSELVHCDLRKPLGKKRCLHIECAVFAGLLKPEDACLGILPVRCCPRMSFVSTCQR